MNMGALLIDVLDVDVIVKLIQLLFVINVNITGIEKVELRRCAF